MAAMHVVLSIANVAIVAIVLLCQAADRTLTASRYASEQLPVQIHGPIEVVILQQIVQIEVLRKDVEELRRKAEAEDRQRHMAEAEQSRFKAEVENELLHREPISQRRGTEITECQRRKFEAQRRRLEELRRRVEQVETQADWDRMILILLALVGIVPAIAYAMQPWIADAMAGTPGRRSNRAASPPTLISQEQEVDPDNSLSQVFFQEQIFGPGDSILQVSGSSSGSSTES